MPSDDRLDPLSVTLRDRSTITMRPIRPDDRGLLHAAFDGLSDESRYRRFLTPMPELSPGLLTYLTEVDHHDHEALIALGPDGEGVGVARFVRGEQPGVAEAAVTVVDDWQGKGVGTALMNLLADRARSEGIRRFTALMLAHNTDMLDLLRRLAPVRVVHREQGTIEVEARLPECGLGTPLRQLLRRSAAGQIEAHPSHNARLRAPAPVGSQRES